VGFVLFHADATRFLDPTKWDNMEELTERYAELTPEKVEEVRAFLKPYFLRRTKDLVLSLPPLVRCAVCLFSYTLVLIFVTQTEIVVPVSMSVLQRQICAFSWLSRSSPPSSCALTIFPSQTEAFLSAMPLPSRASTRRRRRRRLAARLARRRPTCASLSVSRLDMDITDPI
jgi:hypothetical protein